MSPRWIALGLAAFLLGLGLGRTALLDPDEGRYAAASREMIASGDPIVPRFNGEPRLNKPPLFYWAQAAALLAVGETEMAARLPSLLSALALLALTGWWAGLKPARADPAVAVAALASTPLFFACARLAITDMMLALGIGATLLFWHESVTSVEPAARRRFATASALSCGLAVLVKGPVGVILPALVIAATALATRRRRLLTWRGAALAAAGILLVAGPWTVALAGRIGWHGILDLVRREAIERSVQGLDHPRPFHYLLVTFWPLFFPWSLAFPFALLRPAWRGGRERDTVPAFLASWVVVVPGFFSALADKNDAWLLPAAPALALAAARVLPRRAALAGSAVLAILLAGAALLYAGTLSRERSLKEVVLSARLDSGGGRGDYTLLSYRIYRPSLVWYAGRPARWVRRGEELRRRLAEIPAEAPVAIVLERRRLERVQRRLAAGFVEVGATGDYVVLFRGSRPEPRASSAPMSCSCCTGASRDTTRSPRPSARAPSGYCRG